jgi:hypothetical protein
VKRAEAKQRPKGLPGWSHTDLRREAVVLAQQLRRRKRLSLREISAELTRAGYFNERGGPFAPSSITVMLRERAASRAIRKCEYCALPLDARRSTRQYCSNSCRSAAARARGTA